MVSGSPDVSNSFVSPCSNSFVSQSGWWCPALWMSPIHLSPFIAIHLSPSLAGGVRLSGCLQFSPYSNSFVSQSGWWCPALRMSPIHLSPLTAIHLSPSLAGGVRLSGCLQFICPPYSNSFVSQSGWWCPALRMSPIHLSPLIAIHLSPSLAGGVRLSDVSNSFVSPYSNSFVSHVDWWCLALRMSPIYLFPLTAIHLSPSLAGGVRLSGCLQFICLPLIAIHLSPSLAGGVRLSGCLQFICLPLKQFTCLPVWLVVSGSPDVSNSFVSPYSNSFVSQSGWWCPALRMSPIHLSPLLAIHLSPSLAGGVRLSRCLQFICLRL